MKFSKQLVQALPTEILQIQILGCYPDVGVQDCDLITQETETGGWKIQGQPGLYRKILSKKQILGPAIWLSR